MRKVILYLTPFSIIVGYIYITVLAAIQLSPVSFNRNNSRIIYTIVPQGWGFFSRNPREKQTLVYRPTSVGLKLINKSAAESEYYFGLSRISRRINIELGQVFSKIPDSLWLECPSKDLKNCGHAKIHRVKNLFLNPICQGEYFLVKIKPIPWAWSRSYNKINMDFKICHVYVD